MTQINPFRFSNGRLAHKAKDLISLCKEFPEESLNYLMSGDFEKWLQNIGEKVISEIAKEIRKNKFEPTRSKLQLFINKYNNIQKKIVLDICEINLNNINEFDLEFKKVETVGQLVQKGISRENAIKIISAYLKSKPKKLSIKLTILNFSRQLQDHSVIITSVIELIGFLFIVLQINQLTRQDLKAETSVYYDHLSMVNRILLEDEDLLKKIVPLESNKLQNLSPERQEIARKEKTLNFLIFNDYQKMFQMRCSNLFKDDQNWQLLEDLIKRQLGEGSPQREAWSSLSYLYTSEFRNFINEVRTNGSNKEVRTNSHNKNSYNHC